MTSGWNLIWKVVRMPEQPDDEKGTEERNEKEVKEEPAEEGDQQEKEDEEDEEVQVRKVKKRKAAMEGETSGPRKRVKEEVDEDSTPASTAIEEEKGETDDEEEEKEEEGEEVEEENEGEMEEEGEEADETTSTMMTPSDSLIVEKISRHRRLGGMTTVLTEDERGPIKCTIEHNEEQIPRTKGTRHTVVMRDVSVDASVTLFARLREWKKRGFINYIAPEQISSDKRASMIGRYILERRWEDAAKRVEPMPQPDANGNYETAMLALPDVSSYVHAYLCLLWNQLVAKRVRSIGATILHGDMDVSGRPIPAIVKTAKSVATPLPNLAVAAHDCGNTYYKYENLMASALTRCDVWTKVTWAAIKRANSKLDLGDADSMWLRAIFERPTNVKWMVECDEELEEEESLQFAAATQTVTINFDLPAGVAAAVALREIVSAVGWRAGKTMIVNASGEIVEYQPRVVEEVKDEEGNTV